MNIQFPELQYPLCSKAVSLKSGYIISYLDSGEGNEVFLFIHGLGTYAPAWIKVINELKSNFRCIAIDLPGYGRSSAGIHSGKMSFYSDVISDFLNELELTSVNIAGHSMGGQIAIRYSLNHPENVKRLFLLAPAGFETFNEIEKEFIKNNFTRDIYFSRNEEQIRAAFAGNFYNMPPDTESMIQDNLIMKKSLYYYNYSTVVANSLYGMLDEPVYSELNRLEPPVFVIWGENDKLIPHPVLHPGKTPKEIAELGTSIIPGAKLFFLKECGHFIPFEKPGEVIGIIKEIC